MSKPRRVGVVFRLRAVRDKEYLNVVIQSRARPERITLIAVDLVECLFYRHPSSLQFAMHERKSVDQYGHVISVLLRSTLRHVLVEHLQVIVMDVRLVNQPDVLRLAVVHLDVDDFLALNALRLVLDGHLWRSDMLFEEPFPFTVRKCQAVQPTQLFPEVGNECRLRRDVHPFISLRGEVVYKSVLERLLRLIPLHLPRQSLVVAHHSSVLLFGNDIEFIHSSYFLSYFFYRFL